jgi:hypothetical protein
MGVESPIYGKKYYHDNVKVEIVERDHNGAYSDVKVTNLDGLRRGYYVPCSELKEMCMWK